MKEELETRLGELFEVSGMGELGVLGRVFGHYDSRLCETVGGQR